MDLVPYLVLIVGSALIAAFLLYAVGVSGLGAAMRLALRSLGRTDKLSVALVGAVVSAAVAGLLFLRPYGDVSDFIQIGGAALGGALAGLRYRKQYLDELV